MGHRPDEAARDALDAQDPGIHLCFGDRSGDHEDADTFLGDADEDVEEDDEEEDEEEDEEDQVLEVRPWTHPTYSSRYLGRPADTPVDMPGEQALELIRRSRVEFSYDSDAATNAAYLLARGEEETGIGPRMVNAISVALESAGHRIIRHGVRPGLSRIGRKYHYYFRVERADRTIPSKQDLREAVGRGSAGIARTPLSSTPDHLGTTASASVALGQAQVGDAESASPGPGVEQLYEMLQEAVRERETMLRSVLSARHIEDRRIVAYRRRLEDQGSLIRSLANRLRDRNPVAGRIRELEEARASQQEVEQELFSTLELLSEKERAEQDLLEQVEWFQTELATRDDRESALRLASEARGHLDVDHHSLVSSLLPEVRFLADSISVLWRETDVEEWLRILVLLVHDQEELREQLRRRGGEVKGIKGKSGWKEVRRTGSQKTDRARLYFSEDRPVLCAEGQRIVARLSIKDNEASQRRLIKALP